MSGIAGIYWLDGRPVDPSTVQNMVEGMSHRGPDGLNTWHDGRVGLGHAMLRATPEAGYETQPLVHRRDHLVLTADARIDNRDELLRALRLPQRQRRPIADAELILAAYDAWGTACPEYLSGAFAFVIWDAPRRRLFGARDRFGAKPFYYHWAAQRRFVFASEIKGLFAAGEVPNRVNEERVADYLACICSESAYTFYQHIQRLPPGCWLTVQESGMTTEAYWTLEFPGARSIREARAMSEEEAAARFRVHFLRAVRRRCRASPPIGAYLSGGLDSSSVVGAMRAVADEREEEAAAIRTFSAVFDDPECDERQYIRAVTSHTGVESSWHALNAYNPVRELPSLIAIHDAPMEGHLLNITRRLNPIVKDRGVRVVMDGHGGDEVVSHGYGYPAELAQRQEWRKLYREVGGEGGRSSGELFLRYWLRYGPLPQPAARPIWWMLRRLGGGVSASNTRRALTRRVVRPDFARRTGLAERFQASRQAEQRARESARHRHHWILTTPLQPTALEELERTAASFGLETRFPFWDQDLIAFCLALPARLKRQRGVGRRVLRAATTGLVPDMVRTREDKTDFRKSVVAAMRGARTDAQAKWRVVAPSLTEWVDPSAFDELLKRVSSNTMPAEEEGAVLKMIGRLLQLGEWRYKL